MSWAVGDASTATEEAHRRTVLTRRVRWLVAATITYNVLEAIVAVTAGALASSTALVGFGLDSVIEVSSAAAVAWQYSARDPAVRESREKTALRVIALSFFALAAYVTAEAIVALIGGRTAHESVPGIILAALSLLTMPVLSLAQRRTGRELGSASAVADSKQTLLCTYLSGALLVGLLANTVLGWAWADPTVALVISAVAVKEGREAWRGDTCCAPVPAAFTPADTRNRAMATPGITAMTSDTDAVTNGQGSRSWPWAPARPEETMTPGDPMFEFTETVTIDARPSAVWHRLHDLKGWWPTSNPRTRKP